MVEIRHPVPHRYHLRTVLVRTYSKDGSYKCSVKSKVAKATLFLAYIEFTHKILNSVCIHSVLSHHELSAKPTELLTLIFLTFERPSGARSKFLAGIFLLHVGL